MNLRELLARALPASRRARSIVALGLAAAVAAAGWSTLSARGRAPATPPDAAPSQAQAASADPMMVSVDEALAPRLEIGQPEVVPVAEVLRVAGRLETHGYNTARIGAPVTGRVTEIRALLGQEVKAGEELAEIASPELAEAQLAFLRANSQRELLSRAVERAQLLLASDVIGSAELQRRQTELAIAVSEHRAARDQLRSLGLSAARIEQLRTTGHIQPTTAISTTLSGTVIERAIALGQVVQPADGLFVVSDLRKLWAVAELPEQESRFVRPGSTVTIQVPAVGDSLIDGKVAFVADVVNPQTRTVRVGVELANPKRELKPSMLMTMLVEGVEHPRMVVPQGAIVRENDQDHVFLEQANGRFRLVPVKLGQERDGRRPLLQPLPEGARIVLDGAFHLNNVRMQRLTAGE